MLLLTALVAALYWPSLAALGAVWGSDRGTYSQGYLIGALSLWMLGQRGRETQARLQPNLAMLPVVLGLGFLWLICARAGIQTAEAFLLPLILWTAIRAAFGARVARAAVFPCAFLVLAIPVWDPLSAPLQALTTQVSAGILRVAQVPNQVSGNFIHIQAGTFEVAAGCSGLSMLLVGLAIAALYGEMQSQPVARRVMLLALAAAMSLLANWIRVAGIIYAGYLKGMHITLVRDHYGFGWVVFAVMLLGFFPIARRLTGASAAPASRAATDGPAVEHFGVAVSLLLAGLAISPAWQLAADWREPPHVTADLPQDQGAHWTGPARGVPRIGAAVSGCGTPSISASTHAASNASPRLRRRMPCNATPRNWSATGSRFSVRMKHSCHGNELMLGVSPWRRSRPNRPGTWHAIVWLRYTVGGRRLHLRLVGATWLRLGFTV